MQPRYDDGDDSIDNAIPLCFECHAEVHAYNPNHPRGRKFQPSELRKHKEQWLALCKERPEILVAPMRPADVGPLQSLIDELGYNLVALSTVDEQASLFGEAPVIHVGAPFVDEQFRRAISAGALSVIDEELRELIMSAYAHMAIVNRHQNWTGSGDPFENTRHAATVHNAGARAGKLIVLALGRLLVFLGSESTDPDASDDSPTE
jgi:hypothetical protein